MNIIVTGAGRGIGYELVKFFAKQEGHTVIAVSRNSANLDKLADECRLSESPSEVVEFPYDLIRMTSDDGSFMHRLKNHLSSVDILINNAGYLHNQPFESFDREEARKIMEVNFLAPAFLIRELSELMGKTGTSHVVNIGSMGGVQGSSKYNGLSFYSSAKAALAVLTECLANEYTGRNVCFNCLALGAVQTEMLDEAFPGYRAPLEAGEMAKFIAEFALNGYRYFNGKIIPVSVSNP